MKLKEKVGALSSYYDEIGVTNIINWNEGIQYLDVDKINKKLKSFFKRTFKR